MTLSHKEIIELVAALQQLDGVNNTPYKFSDKTRYAFAKNLRLLRNRAADIDATRVSLVRQNWPDGAVPAKDTPEHEKFVSEWEAFLNEKEEISNLFSVAFADLNLDVNPIGVTTLAILGPLINEAS